MLLGLIFPTSGVMKILGREDIGAPDLRRRIGYLPEGAYYPEFLKGEEILRFYGKLYGLGGRDLEGRIDSVLETVRMTYARGRLLRGYSKGMRQRIGLAQALLSDPDILILDEPTTGLDPLARKEMRDILASLRDQGKSLLISSHELSEVELISNRVAILYRGQLQVEGVLTDLLTDRDLTIEVEQVPAQAQSVLQAAGIRAEDRVKGRALLRVPATMSIYDAMNVCKSNSIRIHSVAPRRETLEELFVRTVGDAAAAEAAGTGKSGGTSDQ
jgi:ABC-2 type transport system ATP-binding protein